ncbi:hypothetical protein GOV14_03745 [Candidatus Pacearchaeota archaeon]|nr:hypothetical protein [Candidatus Pacearchaeota archaeon]
MEKHPEVFELIELIGDASICPENPKRVNRIHINDLLLILGDEQHSRRSVPLKNLARYNGFCSQEVEQYVKAAHQFGWVDLHGENYPYTSLTPQGAWIYLNEKGINDYVKKLTED